MIRPLHLITLLLCISSLTACTKTVVFPSLGTTVPNTPNLSTQNIPSTLNDQNLDIQLNREVTRKLAKLSNEVVVNNLLYVSHQSVMIEGEQYVLLNFHTTDNKVYRTRVLESKLNDKILKQLQQLKGATFIGYMPIKNYPNQYFFRQYKNLKF